MHYSTVAAALAFIPTLIAAQLGTAFPDPNYGNDLTFHVKRAVEARYAEADALADDYAMAEAEAEAFPSADTEALFEDLYRHAAYAYPNAFAEPIQTPEQCKAKAARETAGYKQAETDFGSALRVWNSGTKTKAQAQTIATAARK